MKVTIYEIVMTLIIVQHVTVAGARRDGHASVMKGKTSMTLEEAQSEAIQDTKLALHRFDSLLQDTFDNFTSNSLDKLIDTYGREVVTQDQRIASENDELDWSGLDNLPECSNETTANNTICIEKQLSDTTSLREEKDGTNERNATSSKKHQRKTRELQVQVLPRKRRYSEEFKKIVIDKQPPALKKKLLVLPPHLHDKIEKLPPARREQFFQQLAAYNPRLPKKKGKGVKKKKITVDLRSQENVNRLYGDPDQLKEQKRRIMKYKKLYHQFDEYHRCNKKKESWYKKPWMNLKLYYRAVGAHVRLPCNLW